MSAVLLVLSLAAFTPGRAQDVVSLTVEEIQARIEAANDGPPEEKASLVETYQQALLAIGRAAEARTRSQQFLADATGAPGLITSYREELANSPADPPLLIDETLGLEVLVSRLEQSRAELAASRAALAEIDASSEHRSKRMAALPEEIAAGLQNLSSTEEALTGLSDGIESDARRVLLQAQEDEQRATVASLEMERESYEARRELLPLRRDRALRRLTRAESVEAAWSKGVEAIRAKEGDAAAVTAEAQLEDITRSFPFLAEFALVTHELAARRSGESGLPRRISHEQAELELTRAQLEEVRTRSRAARRRIYAGGLTEGMGLILRRDYEWLPKESDLRAESIARMKKLSAAQLELITVEDERATVGDIATATDRLLMSFDSSPSEKTKTATRELLIAQRTARDSVLRDLESLASTFYEHKELANSLLTESIAYQQFIESRILWVRSSPSNPIESLLALPSHATDIARTLWSPATLQSLKGAGAKSWVAILAFALSLFALIAMRPMLKRKRDEMGTLVRSHRTDKYSYTARGLVQILLLALPMPMVAWTLGWLLTDVIDELLRAVGGGLRTIAAIWLVLRFLGGLAGEKGLGVAHFRWSAGSLATLKRELRWFEPICVSLGFVVLVLDRQGSNDWSDSIGRLCFVGTMVALATFTHRLLNAGSQMWVVSPQVGKGLLGKTHGIWFTLASGLPAVLALLAIAGYYYTALEFELRLRYSFGFAIALVLINALLLRWLFITRRRLAVRQALEARERKVQEEAAESEGVHESSAAVIDADKVNIPAIDAQTRQLFKTSITLAAVVGLYLIWASVLPALRGLDHVQILPHLAIVSADTDIPAQPEVHQAVVGAPVVSSSTPVIPGAPILGAGAPTEGAPAEMGLPARLTLADILLATLFALLTTVAARNLPALLELAVLQRLPLDGGARYATSTILRYLIFIAGMSAVSGAVGVGWQQVQWLAAALTFGLAFGLQEIFANFVSGLIILIERPLRVGDIVTVGATEGRVTQLRMRATTIMDWDLREMIVPNKEFITGNVINWTLSDPVNRVVISVGIAYGSDTEKARELLLEAAAQNPYVLDVPEPSAIFRSFGESSLDFQLHVFIANRDLWPEMTDKIHSQIDEMFRKAGIEIAFPQRDLHIRSTNGMKDVNLG